MCFQGVWFMSKCGRPVRGKWRERSRRRSTRFRRVRRCNHVTYVTVEDDDDNDEWVTFAYVAAYTGLMIGWGCVVWGSGWYYPPYGCYGGYYPLLSLPAHLRHGRLVQPATPAPTGAATAAYGPYGGVGMGASYNPRTGTYARGAAAYGPYGSRAAGQAYNPRTGTYAQTRQGSNVYGNWGTSSVQRGDNWAQTAHRENYRTGTSTARHPHQRAAARRRDAHRARRRAHDASAAPQGGDVYAGRDGNVYRKTEGGGWEQSNGSGGWNSVDRDQAGRRRRATRAADRRRHGRHDRRGHAGPGRDQRRDRPARTRQRRADLGQHPHDRSQQLAVERLDAFRRRQLRRQRGGGARGGGGRRR